MNTIFLEISSSLSGNDLPDLYDLSDLSHLSGLSDLFNLSDLSDISDLSDLSDKLRAQLSSSGWTLVLSTWNYRDNALKGSPF